nr:unnamed protein product [Callosobruchus analis]
MYAESFPNRRVPNIRVFYNTFRPLAEVGTVHRVEPGANPGRHAPTVDEAILEAFEDNTHTSCREGVENHEAKQQVPISWLSRARSRRRRSPTTY